jgi:hypothetical protein
MGDDAAAARKYSDSIQGLLPKDDTYVDPSTSTINKPPPGGLAGLAAAEAARRKKLQSPVPTPSPSPDAGKAAKPDTDQDSDIKAAGRSKALNRM